jgi:kinesin family protein 5
MECELTSNMLGNEVVQLVNEQKVVLPTEQMVFTFTKVFGHASTQEVVYSDVGLETVKEVLTGYNGTILAYGPTGSGKTHSMFGTLDDPQMEGLIPRACR